MPKCPCCKQPVAAEAGPIEMGRDGLPIAASLVTGLGVPVVDHDSVAKLRVRLNGDREDHCVAFDRERGLLWRNQVDAAGNYMRRDDTFVIEQVSGDVTLEPIDA